MKFINWLCIYLLVQIFSNTSVTAQEHLLSTNIDSVTSLKKLAGKNQWKEYAGNPVLTPGKKGEWDSWAIGTMSVVQVGGIFHMYYEGWGQKSMQIGHAISNDGLHWTKDSANPVLPISKEGWESGGTWDPSVLYENGVFKMWHGATPQGDPAGKFHWGYAISTDGTHFEKKGIVSDTSAKEEFEDDFVIHDIKSGTYYMYYWDRRKEPNGLCRVSSKNEMNFDFTKAEPLHIEGFSNTPMHKFPHVFQENNTWYLYYAEFKRPHCHDCWTGYATSTDGLNWKVQNGQLLLAQDATIIKVFENLYLMYYGPNDYFDGEGCDIRLAVMTGNLNSLASRKVRN
jgi:hypothetical protein